TLFSHPVQTAGLAAGSVGRITGLNTLGSALAPALFGVLVISAIGTKWALALIVIGYGTMAVRTMPGWEKFLNVLPLAIVLALPATLLAPKPPPGGKVLAFRE